MSLTTVDIDSLGLSRGARLLDVGCGEGRHAISAYLGAAAQVVAIDLSAADLRTAQARYAEFRDPADDRRSVTFLRASALTLPFADDSFHAVVCAEVLEHIPDYRRALAEIRRVLKPGGMLAVSVPRFGPEWLCWRLSRAYHEVAGGHVRIFRTGTLSRAVTSLAMTRIRRHWAHGLHSPYWWLRCLFWSRGAEFWPVRAYHRLLVWDLLQAPRLTRWLERLLNPLIGKSVVLYFRRDP